MCHCLECQRRTGAVISNQARFRREQVTFAGKATAWMRTAESGNGLTFHFCPWSSLTHSGHRQDRNPAVHMFALPPKADNQQRIPPDHLGLAKGLFAIEDERQRQKIEIGLSAVILSEQRTVEA